MNKYTIGFVLVVLTIAGVVLGTSKDKKMVVETTLIPSPAMTDAMMKKDSAPLLDFTKADYDAALQTDKLIVLYFYANWCPICKAEFPMMQSAFSKLTNGHVIGFRVNYNDDQTDVDEKNLAREFGIAYQHTKVFIKNGQRILKSPEGWDEARYVTEINSHDK